MNQVQSQQKKGTKIRVDTNEIKTRKTTEKINESKNFLKTTQQNSFKTLARLKKKAEDSNK